MIETFPEYMDFINPPIVSLNEIQKDLLQENEALVVFQVIPSAILSWTITQDDFFLGSVALPEKELSSLVTRFRRHSSQDIEQAIQVGASQADLTEVINTSYHQFIPVSSRLYDVLFPETVTSLVKDKACLFIVPTGCLYDLPFEALVSDVIDIGRPGYLLYDHAVSYLSSGSMLKLLYQTKLRRTSEGMKDRKDLLAFANPIFHHNTPSRTQSSQSDAYIQLMGGEFSALPETEEEIAAISGYFKQKRPWADHDLFVRSDASRIRVLALNKARELDKYKYIVFATHAVIPGEVDDVLQPAIVRDFQMPRWPGVKAYLSLSEVPTPFFFPTHWNDLRDTIFPNLKGPITKVAFGGSSGNERFVSIGQNVYTSVNGKDWASVYSPPENDIFRHIHWNGDQFLVVGEKYILSSKDGIHWSHSLNPIGSVPVGWDGMECNMLPFTLSMPPAVSTGLTGKSFRSNHKENLITFPKSMT